MHPVSTGASTATASQGQRGAVEEARGAAEAPATAEEAQGAAEAPATAVEVGDAAEALATAEYIGDTTEAPATVMVKEVVEGAAGVAVEVAAHKRPSSPSPLTAAPRAKWSLACDSRRDELLSTPSPTLTAASAAASA
jgi:hypothetical protein